MNDVAKGTAGGKKVSFIILRNCKLLELCAKKNIISELNSEINLF